MQGRESGEGMCSLVPPLDYSSAGSLRDWDLLSQRPSSDVSSTGRLFLTILPK